MKIMTALVTLCLFSFFATGAFAQTLEDRLEALEATVKEQGQVIQEQAVLRENQRKQQQTIDEQRKVIEELQAEVKKNRSSAQPVAAANETEAAGQVQQQVQALNEKVDQVVEAQRKVLPSEFNPPIGLVGESIFSYRNKGASQTGSDRPGGFDFFQRSVELNAAADVGPFAKGYVVANGSADSATGEENLGIEEAALETTSLPWNLTVKAGRFFGEFGRLAYIHDHELPVVNRPLVLDQYIGGESRTDGLQLNWLMPTERYVSLTVGAGNQFGGDNPPNDVGDFRNGSGLNYWGRLSSYFELTPDISVEPGVSGMINPKTDAQWSPDVAALPIVGNNTFTERERRLTGADLVVSWKPLRDNQFQSLTWGTEVLHSDNRYDLSDSSESVLPSSTVGSYGMYSYLTYKWHRQWSAGFMYQWMEDADNCDATTTAYSPYITWSLSHWDQLRLQYTYTDHNAASGLPPDSAVYLQWAWIIGSHSHGWQQR
jgi:hypothetical protein